jgi:hypothetical protein
MIDSPILDLNIQNNKKNHIINPYGKKRNQTTHIKPNLTNNPTNQNKNNQPQLKPHNLKNDNGTQTPQNRNTTLQTPQAPTRKIILNPELEPLQQVIMSQHTAFKKPSLKT